MKTRSASQANNDRIKHHVINDPVHGVMEFSDEEKRVIKPFIDHPNFQRLRHIKQLGMADLVFPGAVHTRFNHCIGCCYVGSRIRKSLDSEDIDQRKQLLTCLLHDIGHGPFSHSFERIYDGAVRHEQWTRLFLEEYATDKNQDARLTKDEISEIVSCIEHQDRPKNKLMADIVSSQLDADRLDYLLRDSHFCGVSYGEYDLNWLLSCMTVIEQAKDGNRLGITAKGMGVVEHYLAGRRLMTRNVYYHGKIQAAEHLLVHFLQRLCKAEIPGLSTQLSKFIEAAEGLRQRHNLFKKNGDDEGDFKKHTDSFIENNYCYYKNLTDLDIWSAIRISADAGKGDIRKIATRFTKRRLPKVCPINPAKLEPVSYWFKKEFPADNWQVAILQPKVRAYAALKDPILMLEGDHTTRDFGDKSPALRPLADKDEKVAYLMVDDSQGELPRKAKELWKKLYEKHYLSKPLPDEKVWSKEP